MSAPQHRSAARRRLTLIALTLVLLVAMPTGSAWAGRVLVTGHDADLHCDGGGIDTGQCHWVAVAAAYVRGAAPDPARKVLAIDTGSLQLDRTLTSVGIPHDTVDPSAPAFSTTPFDVNTYSAIIVASDSGCGGCDLNRTPSPTSETPDSDAINARSADVAAFLSAGGGVLALSGANHGDGDASTGPDTYYSFIPVPIGGAAVSSPFTLTSIGRALGFEDPRAQIGTHDDINCCATHNSFHLPATGSALQVAEKDSQGLAETLVARGTIVGGQLVPEPLPPPVLGRSVNVQTVSGEVFIKLPAGSAAHASATKGQPFVPLSEARQIPVGALIDTRRGTVGLTSAANSSGGSQAGQFTAGIFQILQNRRLRGLTDLNLKGSSFRPCAARKGNRASAALSRRTIRRLRARASGRFRTRGRYSAATVRGTVWTTADRCDGTLTKVSRGVVVVRDFRKRRNITLRAGKSYLARAPG